MFISFCSSNSFASLFWVQKRSYHKYTLNNANKNFELHFCVSFAFFRTFHYKIETKAFLKMVLRERDLTSVNKIIIKYYLKIYENKDLNFFLQNYLSIFLLLNIFSLSWNSTPVFQYRKFDIQVCPFHASFSRHNSFLSDYYVIDFIIVEFLTQIKKNLLVNWGGNSWRKANKRGNWFSVFYINYKLIENAQPERNLY